MKTQTSMAVLLVAASTLPLTAGDDLPGAETSRALGLIFGVYDDPGFGAVAPAVEPSYEGGKAGLVDVNPAGPTIIVDALAGYHSNPGMEIDDFAQDAWFTAIALRAAQRGTIGIVDYYWGVSAKETFYDNQVIPREQDDQSVTDLNLRGGIGVNFAPGARLSTFINHYCSGHLDFSQGAHRYGLSQDQIKRFENRTDFDFRFDGQELGSSGLQFKVGFDYLLYEGEKNNDWDFDRPTLSAAGYYYIPGTETCVGIVGGLAEKNWDRWTIFDSQSVIGGLEARGQFGCGVSWQARAGWESRDYDDPFIDDRCEPFFSSSIRGEITDTLYISWGFYYGIGDLYNNQGGPAFADATTLRNSLILVQALGDLTLRGGFTSQNLKPEVFPGGGASADLNQIFIGADFRVNDTVRLGADVGHGWGDYGFGWRDDLSYEYATARATFKF